MWQIRFVTISLHFIYRKNSVKNLNTLAYISLLSVVIAAVVTKKDASYRSIKTPNGSLDKCLNLIFFVLPGRLVCHTLFPDFLVSFLYLVF